jgi:hypothetical protein
MEPNVFMGYFTHGIACVLSSFGHEQYPSNNIDPPCLITKYLNEGIGFLVGFVKATHYPSTFQKIFMEPNVFLRYPTRGIVGVLNNFGHEHYASNNVDPWCLIT